MSHPLVDKNFTALAGDLWMEFSWWMHQLQSRSEVDFGW